MKISDGFRGRVDEKFARPTSLIGRAGMGADFGWSTAGRVLVLGLVLLVLGGASGCIQNLGRDPGWNKPTTLEFEVGDDVEVPERMAMVFFCDGLNRDVFNDMLSKGQLPHIEHYLVRRGVLIEKGVTSLPTITYGSTVSLITGVPAGHHGVLGNNWFDPQLLVLRRYGTIGTMSLVNDDFTYPTLFELLDREHTVVVTMQQHRGATTWHENWMRTGPAWFFRMFHNVNMTTTARLQDVASDAERDKTFPHLFFLYYPSTDEVGHIHGPGSPQYREILQSFDNEVGDACKAFEKEGLLERTLLVLITDHGMSAIDENYDPSADLEAAGLRVTQQAMGQRDGYYQKRSAHFNKYQAVVLPDGSRQTDITLRMAGRPWITRPSLSDIRQFVVEDDEGRPTERRVDLLAMALAMPATQLVAHGEQRDGESLVHLFHREGRGLVSRRTDAAGQATYAYRVTEGADPLGYSALPEAAAMVGGGYYDADSWVEATLAGDHPAVVPHLPDMFDSDRTGDLVLFALPGWDYGTYNKGGHGGLTRQEILIPMVFAGPGIAQGQRLPWARSLSLTPTVLHFLRQEREATVFAGFSADSLLDILAGGDENAPSVPGASGPADAP